MRRLQFARGERILRQGDPGDSLYFIHQGSVGVEIDVEGEHSDVARLEPGQFFGEMSLMTGEPRAATCAARSDVVLYMIDHAAFRGVLEARPQLAEEISKVLASRQAKLHSAEEELSVEAAARKAAEASSRLLQRIRQFFQVQG